MSVSAWLIEIAAPMDHTLYYCAPGDWCSNPNHAQRFPTRVQAEYTLATMHNPSTMRVAEHEWPDEEERHKPGCAKFKAMIIDGSVTQFPADVPCTCPSSPRGASQS